MEQLENREQYHDVIAASLSQINAAIANKQNDAAILILKCNIVYAYSLAELDVKPDLPEADLLKKLKDMKLDRNNDILSLYTMMTFHQYRAGIKPVQRTQIQGTLYNRVRNKL